MVKLKKEVLIHLDGDRTSDAKQPHYDSNDRLGLHGLGNLIKSGKDLIVRQCFDERYRVDDEYGDEILLSVTIPFDLEKIQKVYEFVENLKHEYFKLVGYTISAGIGDSLTDSKLGLLKAKERLSTDYNLKLSKGLIEEKISSTEFGPSLKYFYLALKDFEEGRVPEDIGPVLIYFYSILKHGNTNKEDA